MLLKVLGKAFVIAMFGFAALLVSAMLVRAYVGGPARPFASAVMRLPTSDLAQIMSHSTVWMQQNL